METFIISTVYDGKPRRLYTRTCQVCSLTFYAPKHTTRKFCSKQCSIAARFPFKANFEFVCDGCGKAVSRKKLSESKTGLRFCTRLCKDNSQRLENLGNILRPECDGTSGYRDVAFRNYPHKCNRCGYNEYIGILRVHHRDRNRSNSSLENLEILCPNCHEIDHYLQKDGVYTGWKKRACGVIESTLPLHG